MYKINFKKELKEIKIIDIFILVIIILLFLQALEYKKAYKICSNEKEKLEMYFNFSSSFNSNIKNATININESNYINLFKQGENIR